MAISVKCECGKPLRVPDEMGGRKVRCPACKAVLAVPAVEEDEEIMPAPSPRREALPPAPEDRPRSRRRPVEEDEEEAPRPRKRLRQQDEGEEEPEPAKKKGGVGKVLLFGCLGVALLGCAGVVGGVVWFVKGLGGIDERLVGTWKLDPLMTGMVSAQMNKRFPDNMKDMRLEFNKDGTCVVFAAQDRRTGKWSKLRAEQKAVRIQINYDKNGAKEVWEFTFIKDARLPGERLAVEKGAPPCVLIRDSSGQSAQGPGDKAAPTQRPQPAFTVTSAELSKEFKTSRAAAEAKYKGKWLAVEGPAADPGLAPGGGVTLRLEGDKAPGAALSEDVRCTLPVAQLDRALRLSRGQKIKVQGKCGDYFPSRGVSLDEAELVQEIGPDPALRLALAAFAREYAANPKNAVDKYQDKEVSVRGVLVELKKGSFADVAIISQSKGKKSPSKSLQVSAAYAPDWKDRFARYKPGDRIHVKGEFSSVSDGLIHVNRCRPVP